MDLQGVVSELAERLGRPVALNDYGLELLAASAQMEVDRYRVAGILRRRAPAEVLNLLQERGFMERSTPFVLPAGWLPGMRARMGAPIQVSGSTVAFLWIILGERAHLDAQEYAAVRETVEEVTALLSRTPSLGVGTVMAYTRMVQRLIATEPVAAGFAAAEFMTEKALDAQAVVWVSVIHAVEDPVGGGAGAGVPGAPRPRGEPGTEPDRPALLSSLAAAALGALDPTALLGVVDGALVLVTASRTPERTLQQVCAAVDRASGPARPVVRATGSAATQVWSTGLNTTYQEAAFAGRLAGRIPEVPRNALHAQLGALALLRHSPWTTATIELISPVAARLVAEGSPISRETVLTYLRNGGDAQSTCAALSIHRTTLYYRLDRAGVHLGDALDHGWSRTNLYLGLLLAELVSEG